VRRGCSGEQPTGSQAGRVPGSAHAYRAQSTDTAAPDPTIGCIILRNLFFADQGRELPQPSSWPSNVVTHKRYDLAEPSRSQDAEYVEHAFTALQQRARIDFAWEPDLLGVALDWQGQR
jgi:hypothetical protein